MTSLAFGGLYGWDTWWIIGGLLLFVVLMPVLLWVERRIRSPLIDLELLRDRLFLMGNLTALAQRRSRATACCSCSCSTSRVPRVRTRSRPASCWRPWRWACVVLSPISGALADRYGSRLLATLGMVVTGVGLAGLTTIQVDTPYWQLALWQLIIGAGSGLFVSPNTSAVMGVVPPAKRGVGAGMRAMLTNTGFVLSIALSIGLDDDAPWTRTCMVKIFSGTQTGAQGIDLEPFIDALHIAFGVGAVASARCRGVAHARPAPGVGPRPGRGHRARRVGAAPGHRRRASRHARATLGPSRSTLGTPGVHSSGPGHWMERVAFKTAESEGRNRRSERQAFRFMRFRAAVNAGRSTGRPHGAFRAAVNAGRSTGPRADTDAAATIATLGAEGSRWVPRSSKPVARRPASRGGFDSHALPPPPLARPAMIPR